ncbi:hypothetical protein INP57_28020 [Saccharopolyspora sp. HNM0986]|uniref:hypothetical protein n=1 Tax=Saccharopolyspora galaxeae TaxID=2781241 RepID=UPI00190C72E4|nr:hypothetical protein [Saccharopolyspora sp. HNM0986]MBK0870660.1 hypothetical protein [Saccharopolyspora sp. HNM0986]
MTDWEGGVAQFRYGLALRNSDTASLRNGDRESVPGIELRDQWERIQFDILGRSYRSYKPDPEFFRQALERIGVTPERIRHVAFGFKYDNAPAKRFGMRTAWINRHDEPQPAGEPADHTWRDLWGLAGLADGRPVPD